MQQADPITATATVDRRPVRVAIVDDMAEFRLLLRLGLEMDDRFEVIAEASDGVAGLACVEQFAPDVVLLDLAMPGMDGLEVLDALAQLDGTTKVVVLSAFHQASAAPDAYRRGAAGYIEKGAKVRHIADLVHGVWTTAAT